MLTKASGEVENIAAEKISVKNWAIFWVNTRKQLIPPCFNVRIGVCWKRLAVTAKIRRSTLLMNSELQSVTLHCRTEIHLAKVVAFHSFSLPCEKRRVCYSPWRHLVPRLDQVVQPECACQGWWCLLSGWSWVVGLSTSDGGRNRYQTPLRERIKDSSSREKKLV